MHQDSKHQHRDFKLAFHLYYNQLCNYAYSFVKDAETSEDLVQELFTTMWEKRRDLFSSEAVRYYLFASIRNNCLSHLQKQRKSVIVPVSDHEIVDEHVQTDQHEPEEINYKQLLAVAIDKLPPKCKEVFILSRISELSHKQIAEQLGISIKTVENQIGKSLKVIRIFLKENMVGGSTVLLLAIFFK